MKWSCPTCKIKKRWFTTDFVDRHNLKFGVDEDGAPHEPEAAHGGGPHQAQRRDGRNRLGRRAGA
jgi:hypothetical protein